MARKSRILELPKNTSKNDWNTALYIRLSKEDGNEESYSVKNQRELLLDFVERNDNEFNIIDLYVDDGYTGTDSDRANFQRLLQDIQNKKINCVIVKDLSRLSRNYYEAGYYLEKEFVKYDVRFISLNNPSIDSYKQPEQMNTVLIPMLNVINDDFCRQTSLKIRAVFDAKRKKGEFIGAFAPYGYQKDPQDNHKFIIDEEVQDVVYNIFHWYIDEGMSKNGIAKKLNSLGILNPSAYKKSKGMKYNNPHDKFNDILWVASSITTILKNPTYLGDMVQGRFKVKSYKIHTQIRTAKEDWFIVEGTHKPIIDQETFNKAQELQQRDTRTAPKKQEVYLFAGFIRCADCKRAMHRKQSGKHIYYFCRTYEEKSKTACTKHTIRLDNLEQAVLYTTSISNLNIGKKGC